MRNSTTKIWLYGASGKMGVAITEAVTSCSDCQIFAGSNSSGHQTYPDNQEANISDLIQNSDLILDFSTRQATTKLVAEIAKQPHNEISVLIGTTDLDPTTLQVMKDSCQVKWLLAPNTSLGIMLLSRTVVAMARALPDYDIEIFESHHRDKKDSPSGTALFLADLLAKETRRVVNTQRSGERLKNEIGVAAIRGGSIFGEHTIFFISEHEEIKLSHRAFSRSAFAKGSIQLGRWLQSQPPGLYMLPDVASGILAGNLG